jgi:hypothetical protein
MRFEAAFLVIGHKGFSEVEIGKVGDAVDGEGSVMA